MDAKKKKNYFLNQRKDFKNKKRLSLESGMQGFFCTCNNREKDCVREAYNILNEYSEVQKIDFKYLNRNGVNCTNKLDQNNWTEQILEKETVVNYEDTDLKANAVIAGRKEVNEDITDALSKEISELKAEATELELKKKFQVVDTGVNNIIFIKSTIPDTINLVTTIIKDLQESKKPKTKYLLRMLPVQIACKAYIDDIKSKASALFEQYFAQEPKTFSIVVNRHSNSNLQRIEVIKELAAIIATKNPGNKTNLKNPEIAVVVEVVRAVCLISIAPNYFAYKKYNLMEISRHQYE
ncbi:THUMP domain-containing protein 1 [Copidosoma floridanum]|uniref:THUMP domain-containing protein 1 n=1 Tax=Copidosoma floridanum TaxID=29053 RepID=UPI0006C9A08E|nr:THUMP domain-containing protein 1 [Copidosoma floridanum]